MTEHTPTPYQFTPYPDLFEGRACGVIECTEAVRQKGRVVAYVRSGPNMPDEEAKANAAFIVRAVNAHDELVAALDRASYIAAQLLTYVGCERCQHTSEYPDRHYVLELQELLAAALAKAKENGT